MKNKLFIIVCLIMITTLIISGCTSILFNGIKDEDREVGKMDNELNLAILNFSWNMFKESSKEDGNIMISPPSAYLVLAMTLNGADKETKTEMLNTLGAKNISLDTLNQGLNDWMYSLTTNRTAKFDIANSIWYREGFNVSKDFLKRNNDFYSAYIKNLDFKKADAPDHINKWVSKATNGTIDKIVEEINEDVMMYLINAIYFKGNWRDEFSANKTNESEFKTPKGKIKTDFMNRRGVMDYIQSGKVEGVVLPYSDESFVFVALLPEEGQTPKDLIDKLNALDLIKLTNNREEKNIELSLPKFESSYEDVLNDKLSALGMVKAFEPYSADFSLFREDLKKDLYISEIKQKTYIKVDEKGTEASAVTAGTVETTSMPLELQRLVFNRPFVYGIIDVETGIPLFIGIMENPAE